MNSTYLAGGSMIGSALLRRVALVFVVAALTVTGLASTASASTSRPAAQRAAYVELRFGSSGCLATTAMSINAPPIVTRVCNRNDPKQRWYLDFRGTTRIRLRLAAMPACVHDRNGHAVLGGCDSVTSWLVYTYNGRFFRISRNGGVLTKQGAGWVRFFHGPYPRPADQRLYIVR